MSFLPVERGDEPFDFVLISGDAYVDHPSFGHALISRLIEDRGFSVGILPQPVAEEDYQKLGEPRIGFLISPGVVDSMVNNYTVSRRRRTFDEYSEEGKFGRRPDRALTVYARTLRKLYPSAAIVAGGVEASLRRFAHYDYWNDCVMPSVLCDAPVDLVVYGMGEVPFWDILDRVERGIPLAKIRDVPGTCYFDTLDNLPRSVRAAFDRTSDKYILCPSYEEVRENKVSYCKAFRLQHAYNDYKAAKGIIQRNGGGYVVCNPPQRPMTEAECDRVYALPFERTFHPMYKFVPAIEEVRFSVNSHRGCVGDCAFCAIAYHSGKYIQRRSEESVLEEVKKLTELPDFKGNIHDVGGPSANFYDFACDKSEKLGFCRDRSCMGHEMCKNVKVSHKKYGELLRKVRAVPGVKRVFIRSGIRFDYLMADPDEQFFNELCKYYVSGQLKVAPEHVSDNVLKLMNKPKNEVYQRFVKRFKEKNLRLKKDQYIVPYFISSHPGCTLKDAVTLTEYLKSINYMPLQVQDFYPTPSTKSTTMFWTGLDPDTLKPVYVARSEEEKAMQRALLQYRKKENEALIRKALKLCGREDLIGNGKNCIIGEKRKEGKR